MPRHSITIAISIPAGYSGSGFSISFNAIDIAEAITKDGTKSRSVEVTVEPL